LLVELKEKVREREARADERELRVFVQANTPSGGVGA